MTLRKPQRVRLSLSVIKLSLHNNVHMKNGQSFIKYCIIQHNCTFRITCTLLCRYIFCLCFIFTKKCKKDEKSTRLHLLKYKIPFMLTIRHNFMSFAVRYMHLKRVFFKLSTVSIVSIFTFRK